MDLTELWSSINYWGYNWNSLASVSLKYWLIHKPLTVKKIMTQWSISIWILIVELKRIHMKFSVVLGDYIFFLFCSDIFFSVYIVNFIYIMQRHIKIDLLKLFHSLFFKIQISCFRRSIWKFQWCLVIKKKNCS